MPQGPARADAPASQKEFTSQLPNVHLSPFPFGDWTETRWGSG